MHGAGRKTEVGAKKQEKREKIIDCEITEQQQGEKKTLGLLY